MWDVINALFFRELKTRFGKNRRLGYLWVVGEPMAQIIAIALIVSAIREARGQVMPEGVSIFMFLVCGIIPFFMFRNITTQLMGGIEGNLTLFAYKPVRPIHVFIARTLLEVYLHFTIFVVLMLIEGIFFGQNTIPKDFIVVLFCFLFLAFCGFTWGVCFAILGHLVEPLKVLLKYIATLFYFASAVMYPIWILPTNILDFILYNPLVHITETLKIHYFDNYPVTEGINILYPIIFNFVLLFIGLWFYYYKRRELVASNR